MLARPKPSRIARGVLNSARRSCGSKRAARPSAARREGTFTWLIASSSRLGLLCSSVRPRVQSFDVGSEFSRNQVGPAQVAP
eukprot:1618793-Pleurochrysis_carterae.AAC.4